MFWIIEISVKQLGYKRKNATEHPPTSTDFSGENCLKIKEICAMIFAAFQ